MPLLLWLPGTSGAQLAAPQLPGPNFAAMNDGFMATGWLVPPMQNCASLQAVHDVEVPVHVVAEVEIDAYPTEQAQGVMPEDEQA